MTKMTSDVLPHKQPSKLSCRKFVKRNANQSSVNSLTKKEQLFPVLFRELNVVPPLSTLVARQPFCLLKSKSHPSVFVQEKEFVHIFFQLKKDFADSLFVFHAHIQNS